MTRAPADAYERLFGRVLFPFYEGVLRGRGTPRHLAQYEANQHLSAEALAGLQSGKIAALAKHCHEEVPYYRDQWREAGIDWRDLRTAADLARLPLLEKRDIKAHRDRLRAGSFRGRTIAKATGGSTGEPLAFEYTRESYERRTAVMWRGYGWAGAAPGRSTAFVWGGHVGEVSRRTRLKEALHHAILRRKVLDSFHLTRDNADGYLAELEAFGARTLVGYVAPLHFLALRRLEKGGPGAWRPEAVITGAERLLEFQRADIERAFGAPVFNTYGCREFMLVASECAEHRGLHANTDHLVVELVDDEGRPARSGRVVVTDLHNFGMPFVRYANGDVATWAEGPCACGRALPRLEKVEGRLLDILRTADGHVVPGEFFPHLLKDVPGVARFQVVQERLDGLTIRLVREAGFDEGATAFVEREVRRAFGEGITLEWDFVEAIALTPGGKQRVTLSLLDGAGQPAP